MCLWLLGGRERPKLPLRVEADRWVGYCNKHGYFINTRRGYTNFLSGHLYIFENGTYLDCPKCEAIWVDQLKSEKERF